MPKNGRTNNPIEMNDVLLNRRRAMMQVGENYEILPYVSTTDTVVFSITPTLVDNIIFDWIGSNGGGVYTGTKFWLRDANDADIIGKGSTGFFYINIRGTNLYNWSSYYRDGVTCCKMHFENLKHYAYDNQGNYMNMAINCSSASNYTANSIKVGCGTIASYADFFQRFIARTNNDDILLDVVPIKIGENYYLYDKISGQMGIINILNRGGVIPYAGEI